MMKRTYLQPLPVRMWHWINALCFFVLIVTGAQIRYRDALNLMTFRSAVDIHNIFGFVLLGNFLVWGLTLPSLYYGIRTWAARRNAALGYLIALFLAAYSVPLVAAIRVLGRDPAGAPRRFADPA